MKLTANQIIYIERYLSRFEIKFYEVYMEILDHLILKTESILENDLQISFEEAVVLAKEESYGKKGFADIVNSQYKVFSTQIRKDSKIAMKNHFTIQNIGWYLLAFLTYFFLISSFEKPEKVHLTLILLLMLISFVYLIPLWKYRKKNNFFVMKSDKLFFDINISRTGFHFSNAIILLGRESIDFHHVFIKMIFTLLFFLSLYSFLIFIQTRKKTITELQTQIFI
uniref:hypothetical protein n=1 Tax=Flavobacterium sp. TaxID=239 RepID=UPI00404AD671